MQPAPCEGLGHPGRPTLALLAAPPPPPRFCGKEAAGAGVAAGASCPCDRAEQGTRGHVGKTLVPAALPARNAPPAPQSPPAWPRNDDSHAPCFHPLGAHPAQPTEGLVRAPSLPASDAAGPLPASPIFLRTATGNRVRPGTRPRLACSGLARNSSFFGTYCQGLPPSLDTFTSGSPHSAQCQELRAD